MKSKSLLLLGAVLGSLFTAVNPVFAQGTAFTYQGRLTDNGSPASGTYDLPVLRSSSTAEGGRFTIFDAATSGSAGQFAVMLYEMRANHSRFADCTPVFMANGNDPRSSTPPRTQLT